MSHLTGFQKWWNNALPHRIHIRRHVPKFLSTCPDPLRGEILELGAGHGWTSRTILETFPHVELTCAEVDQSAQDVFQDLQATYGSRLKIQQADIRSLPFDRESFQVVIAINTIGYIDEAEVQRVLREALRVLRQGGLLGISDLTVARMPSFARRTLVEKTLLEEGCELEYIRRGARFSLWARKPGVDPELY
ncbi:MAG TPA: class I SAM-dependent methyltransferase [Candidatus Andersenbacteria bacterium]|nr:class I SAM-dependent methyltransferase [Candidatus Andersenbacteria bacterium]